MTNIAWICLTIIVLAVAALVAYAIKKKSDVSIQIPLPYGKNPLNLSVNDAKRIILLQNQGVTQKMIEVLMKYNNEHKMPNPKELDRIGEDILRSLAEKAYIEPESTDITDVRKFKFGYVGRQILEGLLSKEDLFDPVSWHDELKSSI